MFVHEEGLACELAGGVLKILLLSSTLPLIYVCIIGRIRDG